MAFDSQNRAIRTAVDGLRAHGVVPGIVDQLERARDTTGNRLQDVVLDKVTAYSDSGNPEVLPQLTGHLERLTAEIPAVLGGGLQGFEFVQSHAERRAGQRFPLEALLHTYRCAHKVLFSWIRDAAIASAPETAHIRRVVAAAADFAIEYADAVSNIATSSYVSHTRILAETESDQRAELMNTLLKGYDESDSRAARLLRGAGYLKQRQSYCVVVARSVNPGEMQHPARAQRMADSIGDTLAPASLRTLIGVRDNLVIAIVSMTRRLSGWTVPQSLLAERLVPYLQRVGPAAFIGLSNDVPSTSHIPRAASEAKLALDFASYGDRVVPYSSVSFRQMLVAHARNDLSSAMPPWYDGFAAIDRKSRGRLSATLRAYADADMNVLRAAKVLSVHPNTIYARAQRISDATGKNPLRYHDLTELLLATECRPEP